jgi:arginyl-tRNA synthetase
MLQSGDAATRELWEHLVAESESHFEQVYALLDVDLSHGDVMGESAYNHLLAETVEELKAKGIAREDDGAWIVTPEGFTGRDGGPAVLIVQKTDGGYTYAATDLAAIRYRFGELGADCSLYVVGAPQSMHFAMIFQTAREAGWLTDDKHAEHVPFGSVLGEDGKMLRTRAGDPIKLIDLLEEAIERASKLVEGADRDVAAAVGIGSLKYADLVNDRERDYTFSWDRMLSLDGNTGVYLQYAVARIRSMLDKAGEIDETVVPAAFAQPAERALALRIVGFPTALEKAVEASKPHILARALYDLAQAFSSFYEKCPVLRAPDEETKALRLILSRATERTLTAGLDLLGIQAPQRL